MLLKRPQFTPVYYIVTLFGFLCLAAAQPGQVRFATREYYENGHRYEIDYLYATGDVEKMPLELSAGSTAPKIHYRAQITVFEIVAGTRFAIAAPFSGLYTELGCVEDAPESLVARALAEQARRGGLPASTAASGLSHPAPPIVSKFRDRAE